MFFVKNHAENLVARQFPNPFLLFEQALYEIKHVVSTLVSIYFGNSQLRHIIKKSCVKFQTVLPEIC